jgi:sugar lactone lactonase YvrE
VFFNDSGAQITWRYDFDGKTGTISNKTNIIDRLPDGVLNDGMVVEYAFHPKPLVFMFELIPESENSNLWIAMWMQHCAMVYSPEGKPLKKITFAAKCVTCPTWGGEHNNILFMASALPLVEEAAPDDEGSQMFRYKTAEKGVANYEFAG